MNANDNSRTNKIIISSQYFGQAKNESEEDIEDMDEDQIHKIFKQEGIMEKE